MMAEQSDDDLSARDILAELALDRVFGAESIRAMNEGRIRTAAFIVPTPSWVEPIASALAGLIGEVSIFQRKDGKRIDDDSDTAKLRIASRPVVFVSTAPRHIPPWFVNSSELFLKLPQLDAGMASALIKRTCRGRVPKSIDELNIAMLDFDELTACLAGDATSRTAVDRLRSAIERKTKYSAPTASLPDFEMATEFGEAHKWGMQLKLDIDDYRRGSIQWQDVDRGAILFGPPGTGKTLFAKSLARFLEVPLIQTNLAELFTGSGYLDAVIKGQRAAFEQARAVAPSIMLIDELDQLPDIDKTEGRNRDYWAVVVADFLMALDGSDAGREGVVVIGATNRPEAIAPAVKRNGRLEREIYLGPPGPEGIERIMRHHGGYYLDDVDLKTVSGICFGRSMTAADVMEIVRSARRLARRENRALGEPDIKAALMSGEAWPEDAMTRIATHEAGHCLAALLLSPESLRSVTLSMSHGSFTSFDVASAGVLTAETLRRHLLVLLSGRQAEIIVHGNAATGSGGRRTSDLAKAAAISASAVTSYGLVRPNWICEPDDVYQMLRLDPGLRAAVDADLAKAATEAEELLRAHLPALAALSTALLAHRFLDVETMRSILAGTGDNRSGSEPAKDAIGVENRFESPIETV